MTKSHNPQFKDDETRYVRYAPCLCFRFLQTCQYVTYVVLLACVIYIFFSVTSWHTSVTPVKHHPHSPYRLQPNGLRPSGFGLRMKQSHGYHRSMFHNKRIFSGNEFNPWLRKKIKSKVSPFTIDDVLAFPKKDLMGQDRKSDYNRKVFPLGSGGQYKYAGTDRKALDILPLMSTKGPKRLTGTPSKIRLGQTSRRTKTANRGKVPTIEERNRLSTQGLPERGLQGGLKKNPANRGKALTIEERTRLSTQGLPERVLQGGLKTKPANRGKALTIEERTRLSTQVLPERGLEGGPIRTEGHVHFEGIETKQRRVMSESKSGNGHVDTGKLSGKQHNIAMKLPIVKKDDAVAKNGPKGKNPVAFEKVQMKKMRVDKQMPKRLKGKSYKKVFSNQPRVLNEQQKGRRGKHIDIHPFPSQRNQRKFDLLHDTKVIPKTRESLTSTKGNFSGESASSVQTRLGKLKLRGPPGRFPQLRSIDGTKSQHNVSLEISRNNADIGLPKGTQTQGKKPRTHVVGKLNTVNKGSLGRTENSSRYGNERKLHVAEKEKKHKITLPIAKNEYITDDQKKLQQKRPDDPTDVRGQGHNDQRSHGDVRPHNNELRKAEERGRQVIRGQGHNVARGHNVVRPRDDIRRRDVVQGHGDVRGPGHDSAQSHTGVRAHGKVRPQDRLQGHDSTRGDNGVRGNTIGKDHVRGQFGAHVDLRGHEGSRGHASQRSQSDAQSQGHLGTKVDQRQQGKPTGTKYTGDKMESNPKRSMMTRSARPSEKTLNPKRTN